MSSLALQASLFQIWGFLTRKFNILVLWIVAVLLLLVCPWFLDIQEQRVWCKCKAAMHNFKINIYLKLGQSCLKLHLCVNLWKEFVRMQVMCHIWGKNVDTNMVCTNHITYLMQFPNTNFTKLVFGNLFKIVILARLYVHIYSENASRKWSECM